MSQNQPFWRRLNEVTYLYAIILFCSLLAGRTGVSPLHAPPVAAAVGTTGATGIDSHWQPLPSLPLHLPRPGQTWLTQSYTNYWDSGLPPRPPPAPQVLLLPPNIVTAAVGVHYKVSKANNYSFPEMWQYLYQREWIVNNGIEQLLCAGLETG